MYSLKKKPVARAGDDLAKLIRVLGRRWRNIPLAQLISRTSSEPLWKIKTPIRGAGMKVVACTICPIEDGKGFVADMQVRWGWECGGDPGESASVSLLPGGQ